MKDIRPHCRAEREAALGLAWLCSGGSHSLLRLLPKVGPAAIWKAPHSRLRTWGVSEAAAARFLAKRRDFSIEGAEALLTRREILFVPYGSALYPRELAQLECPPAGLFVRGERSVLAQVSQVARVTIVGTRKATWYGLRATDAFAASFASRGVVVVSGMAMGIDGRAHQAALDAQGLTIAILGCGVDYVYPRCHRALYERIRENGAIMSELPPGSAPTKWTFPHRNRLLAALGDGLLVVEGSRLSGALQTAGWALDLGRPVFAVPGPIAIDTHIGCNQLLYEGAGPALDPAVTVDDFLVQTRIHVGDRGLATRAGKNALAAEERLSLQEVPPRAPGEVSPGGLQAAPQGAAQAAPQGVPPPTLPAPPQFAPPPTLQAAPPAASPAAFLGGDSYGGLGADAVLAALGSGPCSVDGLIDRTGLAARHVNSALARLEIAGLVVRAGPGQFVQAL